MAPRLAEFQEKLPKKITSLQEDAISEVRSQSMPDKVKEKGNRIKVEKQVKIFQAASEQAREYFREPKSMWIAFNNTAEETMAQQDVTIKRYKGRYQLHYGGSFLTFDKIEQVGRVGRMAMLPDLAPNNVAEYSIFLKISTGAIYVTPGKDEDSDEHEDGKILRSLKLLWAISRL
jgi:hypothetical protein